jgi:hypothetical protein
MACKQIQFQLNNMKYKFPQAITAQQQAIEASPLKSQISLDISHLPERKLSLKIIFEKCRIVLFCSQQCNLL